MLRFLIKRNTLYYFVVLMFSRILLCQEMQYPPEWQELFSDSGWTLVKEKKQIKVFEKSILVSSVPALRVELITHLSAEALLNVAWAVDKYSSTLHSAYTTKSGYGRILNKIQQQGWQIIDIPFLAPRLYQFNHLRTTARVDWIKSQFSIQVDLPNNIVIPPVNFGSWEVVESEKKNTLIYRVCTDPGGIVPSWIVKNASRNYIPDMLMELEQAAKKLNMR